MANEQNLKKFTSVFQPPGWKKSRKGIPNRQTVLEKWLGLTVKFPNKKLDEQDNETGEKTFEELEFDTKISVYDAVNLALIQKAQSGDVAAIKEIQDTIFGKITEKQEIEANVNLKSVEEFNKESDARIKAVEAQIKNRE